ncbi:MAG: hypothetical protein NVS3B7_02100 [Candidatus Elarobacter sp.]
MKHARRPRALAAALALVSLALAAAPPATTAATTGKPAASRTTTATTTSKPAASHATTAKRSRASSSSKKTALKKPAAKQTGYHPHNGPAPADEYFGRLGMSILGVRNKVKDLGLEADVHPDRDRAVLTNALWVEDAMRDWAKRYPFDRWLPRYAYALEVMYERIPGEDAHKRAVKQVSYLTAYFPQTLYGRVGRAKLVTGIPTPDPSATPQIETELERLALLDGKVLPTIPPAATPTPSPTSTPEPSSSAAPSSTVVPSSSAAPASTAVPSSNAAPSSKAVPSASPAAVPTAGSAAKP